jgi:hypothetical protein
MRKEWSDGVLEQWSNAKEQTEQQSCQHSSTPILHYSRDVKDFISIEEHLRR